MINKYTNVAIGNRKEIFFILIIDRIIIIQIIYIRIVRISLVELSHTPPLPFLFNNYYYQPWMI